MFQAKITRSCTLDKEASVALDGKQFVSFVRSVCVAPVLVRQLDFWFASHRFEAQGRPF